jgi:hypothetical protein
VGVTWERSKELNVCQHADKVSFGIESDVSSERRNLCGKHRRHVSSTGGTRSVSLGDRVRKSRLENR